jgi:hypothetical protein
VSTPHFRAVRRGLLFLLVVFLFLFLLLLLLFLLLLLLLLLLHGSLCAAPCGHRLARGCGDLGSCHR